MRYYLALFGLLLGVPALAQPTCPVGTPTGAIQCLPQATAPLSTDVVSGVQQTGPTRSNQTVKVSLSQIVNSGFVGSFSTLGASGAASLLGGGTLTGTFAGNPTFSGVPVLGAGATLQAALTSSGGSVSGSFGGSPTWTGTHTFNGASVTGSAPFSVPVSLSTAVATGAPSTQTLADLATETGVPIESFFVAGDPDYTAAFGRAKTAGVPIKLRAATYTVNNFNTGAISSFTLIGIPGKSIIQRTVGTGSSAFFQIGAANVVIDGVTFDSNSGSVSANQWGVLLSAGGQAITIRNSKFMNNSGSLGACLAITATGPAAGGSFLIDGNEITNCATLGALSLLSVSNGMVNGNYVHDNGSNGITVASLGAASGTNYSRGISVNHNRIIANGGNGISIGGRAPPYNYNNPQAIYVEVRDNDVSDNIGYGISLQADYLSAIGNRIWQNTSALGFGGMICFARYSKVIANSVNMPGSSWGTDCGGAVQSQISDNQIVMSTGTALNLGAGQSNRVSNNTLIVSGTAIALLAFGVDGDSNNNAFPLLTAGIDIDGNHILIGSNTATGLYMPDNPGAVSGLPMTIRNNRFDVSGGASAARDIFWKGAPTSIRISNNLNNGSVVSGTDPNGSGDVIFENVFLGGGEIQGISSTTDIRSFISRSVSENDNTVSYVDVTNGGSGYTLATTTMSATCSTSGASNWAGFPLINAGVIIGVRTTAIGTACVGTVTVTAVDSGGGAGAVFAAVSTSFVPQYSRITAISNSIHAILDTGGIIGIQPHIPLQTATGTETVLEADIGGTNWRVVSSPSPSFASASLPTCGATTTGATIIVTGSGSGKWIARCLNGTGWVYADGTVAP